jgi:hypothetical protein
MLQRPERDVGRLWGLFRVFPEGGTRSGVARSQGQGFRTMMNARGAPTAMEGA